MAVDAKEVTAGNEDELSRQIVQYTANLVEESQSGFEDDESEGDESGDGESEAEKVNEVQPASIEVNVLPMTEQLFD